MNSITIPQDFELPKRRRKFKLSRVWRRSMMKLDQAVWWVRYRVQPGLSRHKLRLGVSPGWYEPDEQMLNAMMACLRDFIEAVGGVEKLEQWSRDIRETNYDEHGPEHAQSFHERSCLQADSQDEAAAIWRWWKDVRPVERKAHDAELLKWFGYGARREEWDALTDEQRSIICAGRDAYMIEEERLDAKDEEMLARLLKIRRTLWT